MTSAKVDLHVHSHHSPDSRFQLGEIIYLVEDYKLPLVTITDHDCIDGCLELMDWRPDIPLLPGIELTCKEGDFLVYCLDEKRLLPWQKKVPKSISEIKRDDSLAIVWAHPLTRKFGEENGFYSQEENLALVMECIDGVEVLNGNVMTRVAVRDEPQDYPDRMRSMAQRFGKAQLGGSDSHNYYSFMKCYTEIPAELATPAGVIQAIKHRLTVPQYEASYYQRLTNIVFPKRK